MAFIYPKFRKLEKEKQNKLPKDSYLLEYLEENSEFISKLDEREKNKILLITSYDKILFCNLIYKTYERYFSSYWKLDKSDLIERIEHYFNLQKKTKDIKQIKKTIKWQYVVVKYFTNTIGKLSLNNIPNSSTTIVESNIEFDKIKELLSTFFFNLRIKKKEENIDDNEIEYTDKDEENFEKLSKSLDLLIKDLLIDKIKTDSKQCNDIVAYGSYTAFNINEELNTNLNIKYGDIDIYHNNNFVFLICLQAVIKFITNLNTTIRAIPYISGYLNLTFIKNENILLDVIYLDSKTLEFLQKTKINGKLFVNPILQFLNNIRMSSEIERMYNYYDNFDEHVNRNSLYLFYYMNVINPKFELKTDFKFDLIKCEFINNVIYLNLESLNKKLKISTSFDYILVYKNLADMIKLIKRNAIQGRFSKKFHAFLNEIFFETNIVKTEEKNNPDYTTSNTLFINKEFLKKYDPTDSILIKIKNKRCLIMTNLTTSLYFNTTKKGIKIHPINIQSIIATFINYLFLHRNSLAELYLNFLLSILKEKEDLSEFSLLKRHKIQRPHEEILIEPITFKSIKFYEDDGKDYYTKEDFINNYNIDPESVLF